MSAIAAQRCFNHVQREAAARCIVCGSFFCRECIAEHAGRMTCARCLIQEKTTVGKSRLLHAMVRAFQLLVGVVILWVAFFLIGKGLLRLPSSFHEGTLWGVPEAER